MAYRYSPDLAMRCQNNCVAGSFRSTIDPFLSYTELALLLHLTLGQRRNMLAAQVKIAITNIAFVANPAECLELNRRSKHQT